MTGGSVQHRAVLMVDIAGNVALHREVGDQEAARRIHQLLADIVAAAKAERGDFIRSHGDDLMIVFEHEPVAAAARVAILAQQLARQAGLKLYAGLHAGDVELTESMGHPDANGQAVNMAGRLHKLTEGAPGRIFLAESSARALPPELQAVARRYGPRDLKGVGTLEIWTLDWEGLPSGTEFVIPAPPGTGATLALRRGSTTVELTAGGKIAMVGRGSDCSLCVPDPALRVSSQHLTLEANGGRWFIQDISRNGTWIRTAADAAPWALPASRQVLLPQAGMLSLGRPFADDPEGRFAVSFTMADVA